ncbi:hypothetical protein HDV05_006685, partial [Chytridiales sp. JEL 0842]
MGRLDGKVALITGAGSGIGFESALLFAKEGAHLVLADLNPTALQTTLDRIHHLHPSSSPSSPPRAVTLKVDVSNESDVKQAVELAEKTYGKLNIVFNNAGIMHPADDDAIHTDEKVWDLTMGVNVKGVWFGCRHAIPALRRAGGGSIINTASFVAKLGAATPQLAYTASKGAVLAMTRELAVIHA